MGGSSRLPGAGRPEKPPLPAVGDGAVGACRGPRRPGRTAALESGHRASPRLSSQHVPLGAAGGRSHGRGLHPGSGAWGRRVSVPPTPQVRPRVARKGFRGSCFCSLVQTSDPWVDPYHSETLESPAWHLHLPPLPAS